MKDKADKVQNTTPMLFRAEIFCLVVVAIISASLYDRLWTLLDFLIFKASALYHTVFRGRFLYLLAAQATFVVAAVWEAVRVPRLDAHATPLQLLRTFLQFWGDLLLTPVHACLPGEIPTVRCQQTPENAEILARCPSLQKRFKQTPWLHNCYLAWAVLLSGDHVDVEHHCKKIRRETLTAADGGVVALDWWEDDDAQKDGKASSTPKGVIFIGSTWIGDALTNAVRRACIHFTSEGWRVVVMVKRGCGGKMPNWHPSAVHGDVAGTAGGGAKPWCFLGLEDTKLAIDWVARSCPGLPICGFGLSTGAGQLRGYVNMLGKESRLAAAVLVDAAPAWGWAVESFDNRVPLLSKVLVAVAEKSFRRCGVHLCPVKVEDEATDDPPGPLGCFIRDYMAPAHGFERSEDGAREYMQACTTASSGCAVPVLELCTLSDMLSTTDMIRIVQGFHMCSPNIVAAVTRNGTHMVRWEGWRPRCWVSRVAAEFLGAAVKQVVADQ